MVLGPGHLPPPHLTHPQPPAWSHRKASLGEGLASRPLAGVQMLRGTEVPPRAAGAARRMLSGPLTRAGLGPGLGIVCEMEIVTVPASSGKGGRSER